MRAFRKNITSWLAVAFSGNWETCGSDRGKSSHHAAVPIGYNSLFLIKNLLSMDMQKSQPLHTSSTHSGLRLLKGETTTWEG